ncbi:MAG: MATE family efflux transporter [Gammaproteobacteria bacterium]|nr:MATE family efflux transporter [Gammaproteobacteria bacterium]
MSTPAPPRRSVRVEALALLRLAGPLIANNLALAGMNFADAVMAGRLSARDLAAVAVGSAIWIVVFLFGLGVLMAMSPTAAQCYGAGESRRIGAYTRQALWLGVGLAAVLLIALLNARHLLVLIGIDASIVPLTSGYVSAIAWGLPAIYAYLALRFTSEGIGWTRPIMYIALLGFVSNVIGNYVLMYGKLGFPAMGAVGCGLASAIAMWIMFAAMLVYVLRTPRYGPLEIFTRFDWPHPATLRELLALGLPIGASVVAEAGLFSTVALLMGKLGATIVAAHQIAINYAATMFMVPLGLHSATTIRVGHAIGRGQLDYARFLGYTGIGLCACVMAASAVFMLVFKDAIVGLYTSDEAVANIAVSLLFVAAIFQISDGLQVGAAGALRGFKDTRVPMLLNFFSYWLVGFPLAWYLGLVAGLGPQAVWIGLVAGLSVAAILLTWRFALISACAKRGPS